MSEHTHEFEFKLGDTVIIEVSGEVSKVIGRGDQLACDDQYLIRYKAADGRACESWWTESALVLAPTTNN